jgi:hypothetical protein
VVGHVPAAAAAAVVSDEGESFAGDVAPCVRLDPHALMLAVKSRADRPMTQRREFMESTLVQMKIIFTKMFSGRSVPLCVARKP